ncbi:type II toxin-antitoxin system RelE family toxin [Maribellus sediminis]|uniref:type II toxin-antitoxin system RelE family toxin n=1 Tax=Maribellus sediminis TaxID=2696285 RepID=UPI0014313C83|nr:type II toxin-antitoxin system mRNA interferase toxin, RelE/StbE family [Maribellus sediminis]
MQIRYSEKAVKQLKKINRSDKNSAKLIIGKIEDYANNPSGNFDVKVLKGRLADFKRLRIGNYRVIFDEQFNILNIYEVKHRKEAYK